MADGVIFRCQATGGNGYTDCVFRLTREVRFAINALPDGQLEHPPSNSYSGYPSLTGGGQFFALQVSLRGELQPQTSYLLNIKRVDEVVRQRVIPLCEQAIRASRFGGGAGVLLDALHVLRDAFAGEANVDAVKISMSPFFSLEARELEHPMVRLSQKFEFSASHRLHNPKLTDEQNRSSFGKCNNPHGHGHNYELQVTLVGEANANGVLIDVPEFERIVARHVIERLDHKNLNIEVPEFADLIPSVENIARVIFQLLKPKLEAAGARLGSVTVWETPKTWCEYAE